MNEQIQKKYKVRSQLLHSWKLVMPEKLAQPLDYLSGKEFIAPLPAAFKKVLKGEGLETAGVKFLTEKWLWGMLIHITVTII